MASRKSWAALVLGTFFGLAAGCAGSYLYWQHWLDRIKEGWTLVPVVVFYQSLPAGSTLEFKLVAKMDMPEYYVTPGMVKPGQFERLEGRKLYFPVDQGNYLTLSMLENPVDGGKPEIDVKLKPVGVSRLEKGGRWKVMMEVSFTNKGGGVFELDKATACDDGYLSNQVFRVQQIQRELDYRGKVRKRAHPGKDGFFKLKSGDTHTVLVDVGEHYDFPASGGTFNVKFDHFNHFSINDVQLTSKDVQVKLRK